MPKKIKDRPYVINLDEYADISTHWMDLFCNRSEIFYFNSFDVGHVPEEIKEFARNTNIEANIFRVQANNSVMCGYFCVGFIDFMLAGKKQTDFNSFFCPYDFRKNDNIILSCFKDETNKTNLSKQTKFLLSKINKIENYFHQEINQAQQLVEFVSFSLQVVLEHQLE